MASVFDVSAYILKRTGAITHMKLQKLVYYSQAWSLVWDETPLFNEPIEAWANGPVCPALYQEHRGEFIVEGERQGDHKSLNKDAKETIQAVLRTYGDKSAQWLSNLTHSEAPWKDAREGLGHGMRGTKQIGHGAMADFYSGL